MKNKIKLIWNFSGIDSLKIAEHHLVHLKEYVKKENLEILNLGNEKINEYNSISYIVIIEKILEKIKYDLKPHQAYRIP